MLWDILFDSIKSLAASIALKDQLKSRRVTAVHDRYVDKTSVGVSA